MLANAKRKKTLFFLKAQAEVRLLAAHLAKLALTNLPHLRRDGGKNNRNFYPHTKDTKYSPLKILRFDTTGLIRKNARSFSDSPLFPL